MKRIKLFRRSPLTLIELVIYILSIIGGIYVLTPLFYVPAVLSGASAILDATTSIYGLLTLGTVATGSGILGVVGISRYNWHMRSIALFTIILLRSYATTVVLLTLGIFPLSWLSGFGIAVIASICWVHARMNIHIMRLEE